MPVTKEPGTLTDQQAATLKRIAAFVNLHGFPPTTKELSQSLGFSSPCGAAIHIKALIKKGYLTKRPKAARGLKILRENSN